MNLHYGIQGASAGACKALISNTFSYEITQANIEKAKQDIDKTCKKVTFTNFITTNDGITFFEINPAVRFGSYGGKINPRAIFL